MPQGVYEAFGQRWLETVFALQVLKAVQEATGDPRQVESLSGRWSSVEHGFHKGIAKTRRGHTVFDNRPHDDEDAGDAYPGMNADDHEDAAMAHEQAGDTKRAEKHRACCRRMRGGEGGQ